MSTMRNLIGDICVAAGISNNSRSLISDLIGKENLDKEIVVRDSESGEDAGTFLGLAISTDDEEKWVITAE